MVWDNPLFTAHNEGALLLIRSLKGLQPADVCLFFFSIPARERESIPAFYRGGKDYFLLLICRRFCTIVHPYSVKFVK